MFQFHMVRLKGSVGVISLEIWFVSIPHGSIKSVMFQKIIQIRLLVSIPHGSIKSVVIDSTAIEGVLFQFHMVRLKERQRKNKGAKNTVSIPHGSIKRTLKKFWIRVKLLFQFHMVRLKVASTSRRNRTGRMFQFHMVRLKVEELKPP